MLSHCQPHMSLWAAQPSSSRCAHAGSRKVRSKLSSWTVPEQFIKAVITMNVLSDWCYRLILNTNICWACFYSVLKYFAPLTHSLLAGTQNSWRSKWGEVITSIPLVAQVKHLASSHRGNFLRLAAISLNANDDHLEHLQVLTAKYWIKVRLLMHSFYHREVFCIHSKFQYINI